MAGRRVDGVHLELGELVPRAPLDRRRSTAVETADARARAAAVVGGRDDEHVVTVGHQRAGEHVDPGGVDAVVVGHQDAHRSTVATPDERRVKPQLDFGGGR